MFHFNRPVSIAAEHQNIFVSIRDRGAIYRFSETGHFIQKIETGDLIRIRGLRCFRNLLYAVNQTDSTIMILNHELNLITKHDLSQLSPLLDSIDLDEDGTIYCTDYRNHCVYRVDDHGLITVLGKGIFKSPRGLRVFEDSLYVCDRDNDCIRKIDKHSQEVQTFLSHGRGDGYIRKPTDLEIVGDKIYVCDQDNYLIQIFRRDFKFLRQIGGKGTEAGTFDMANALCLFKNEILVSNRGCDRVDRLDPVSNDISLFILPEKKDGIFNRPSGVCIDRENKVYIADRHNNCIQIFSAYGQHVKTLKGDSEIGFNQPTAVELDSRGNLIIVDRENHRLVKFDGKKFGEIEILNGLKSPRDIAIDWADNLYVADTGNHRIIRINANLKEEEAICKDIRAKSLHMGSGMRLYASDFDQNKIFLFGNQTMTELTSVWNISHKFYKIRGICQFNNFLYVVDRDDESVLKFNADGNVERKIGGRGIAHGCFRHPVNIKIQNGKAYLVDRDNDRIEVFDLDLNYLSTIGYEIG